MKVEDFNVLMRGRFEELLKRAESKAKEYASDVDRLHNFTQVSDLNHTSRARACFLLMSKHFVSLSDLINSSDINQVKIPTYMVEEKIGDCILYCVLLEALLKEESQSEN